MPSPETSSVRIVLTAAGSFIHTLPSGTTRVELMSGHFTPLGDGRRLGACITSVALDGTPVALDRAMFAEGFHEVEERDHSLSRWTNGRGVLIVSPKQADQILELGVAYVIRSMEQDE